ncbi:hypothetical protein [Streptomyces griseoloalbus]
MGHAVAHLGDVVVEHLRDGLDGGVVDVVGARPGSRPTVRRGR